MLAGVLQPREGRHKIAQGVSPGSGGPHPTFGTALPPGGRGDGGEGGRRQPTAYAVGYRLSPAPRAEFSRELLTYRTSLAGAVRTPCYGR